jgi:hypothetical protein
LGADAIAGATDGSGATVVDTGFSCTGFEEQAVTTTSAAAIHDSNLIWEQPPQKKADRK